MLDESFQRALLTLPPSEFGDDTVLYGLVKGYTYRARGKERESRAYYDSTKAVAERRHKAIPADPAPIEALAWARALQGQVEEAFDLFERAVKQTGFAYIPEKNAIQARLALFAGDTARALSELETRGWGSEVTVPWLCADHFWDALRQHPRFQRLVGDRCRAQSR